MRFIQLFKKLFKIMTYLLIAIVCYVLLVVVANRWIPYEKSVSYQQSSIQSAVQPELDFISWNLGYGGLGANANFVKDGGTDLLPESRETVQINSEGISATLGNLNCDVLLLQEAANSSYINRHVDLNESIKKSLDGFRFVYSAEVKSKLVPYPLKMDMGKATASKTPPISTEGVLLPLEDVYFAGILQRQYRMLVSRFQAKDSLELVVINVHLAAFDDGETRLRQLKSILEFATKEYEKGNHVVVGGDWNLRLVETDFEHKTEEKYLFWLADFPTSEIPEGWRIAADDQVPSVRTVHKAFVAKDNYTCVIDGFLLSPNVSLLDIRNIDVGFKYSDHQPVQMKVILN